MKKKSSVKKLKPAQKPLRRRSLKAKSPEPQLKWGQQIWPLERDVLFRPDRFKYVRKLLKPEGCVFCVAAQGQPSFENLCVFRSKFSMIVLNKFPYNSGHLLVLPLRHCGDLLELTQEESNDFAETTRIAMRALNATFQPGGMNLGINHGAVAGAGIPSHLHQHLIPRWSGDLNFFPLIAETKVVIENLEQTWERLHRWFQTHQAGDL